MDSLWYIEFRLIEKEEKEENLENLNEYFFITPSRGNRSERGAQPEDRVKSFLHNYTIVHSSFLC